MTLEDRLVRASVLGIQDLGDAIMRRSQQLVPVRSGKLKRSGRVTRLRDGVSIRYTSPYATMVESGTPEYIASFRGYQRRSRSGKVHSVRGYTTITRQRRPRRFVGQALDELLPKVPMFIAKRLSEEFR